MKIAVATVFLLEVDVSHHFISDVLHAFQVFLGASD